MRVFNVCEATIREVREEDLDQVIEINLISLKEHYPVQFWRDHLQLWGKIFLVAEVDSRIVGYVMTRIERGFSFLRRFLRKLGHVVSIAVHPNYRRRGIGSALMVEVLKRMKDLYNVDEAYLEVRVSNTPAIKLYEKLGFKIVKVIKYYYADGEDAYLMAREF